MNYDNAVALNPNNEDDSQVLKVYDVLAHGGAYGISGPIFARELMDWGVEKARKRVKHYEDKWTKKGGVSRAGAAGRVVKTAALFATAAEVCQDAGLLPANDDDFDAQSMIQQTLIETLHERSSYLDTERQELDAFHAAVLNAINSGQIISVKFDASETRAETLGYWRGEADYASDFNKHPEVTPNMLAREYIVPVRNLPKLGVKIDAAVLAQRLKDADALLPPKGEKSKYAKRGLWESTPLEGAKVKSIRFSGQWVHGG